MASPSHLAAVGSGGCSPVSVRRADRPFVMWWGVFFYWARGPRPPNKKTPPPPLLVVGSWQDDLVAGYARCKGSPCTTRIAAESRDDTLAKAGESPVWRRVILRLR
jgi:hypothetical protein